MLWSKAIGAGGQGGGSSSIPALFQNGEGGFWYDPFDLSTMWTSSAATTQTSPVLEGEAATSANEIGRIDDKSGNGNNSFPASEPPILRVTSGGLYYIEFNGVDTFLLSSISATLTAQTTHMALSVTSSALYDRFFTQAATSNNDSDYLATGHYIPLLAAVSSLVSSWANSDLRSFRSFTIGQNTVLTSHHSGSQITNRANGAAGAGVNHTLNLTIAQTSIGARNDGDNPASIKLFGIVSRFASSTSVEIADVESEYADLVGATLA